MSFTVIPVTTGYPTAGVSLPNMVSFAVVDDGSGGSALINGLGIGSGLATGAVDLKTLFGSAFRSIPLLKAFRANAGALATVNEQFIRDLEIACWPLGGTGLAAMPAFIPLQGVGSGGASSVYMSIAGPAVAGTWRVEMKLRHSFTD